MPSKPDSSKRDSADALTLPDDLAALASQLSADAEQLSACYPADSCNNIIIQNGRRALTTKSMALAASVLAMAASVAGLFALINNWLPERSKGLRTESSQLVATDAASAIASTSNRSEHEPLVGAGTSSVTLTELSSPEMEALLDLWEREANDAPSIAF